MRSRHLFAAILMACLLVAGLSAAMSYLRHPKATGSSEAGSFSGSHSKANGVMLARLEEYASSKASQAAAPLRVVHKGLPDVNTMIERLVARLETTPEDVRGWRMLGWSYFHTSRYRQAAAAYARALELDPNSSELKLAYQEAKAKASDN